MEVTERTAKVPGEDLEAVSAWLEFEQLLDERLCREKMLHLLHRDGARCPSCGFELAEKQAARFWSARRIRCSACGKFFTALTGTAFDGFRRGFREMALMTFLVAVGLTNGQISTLLRRDVDTIRLRRKKMAGDGA